MYLSARLASYRSRMKVISLVKSHLVFYLLTWLTFKIELADSSSDQVQRHSQVFVNRCNFSPQLNFKTVVDFIQCISNEDVKNIDKRETQETSENLFNNQEYYSDSPESTRSFFNFNILKSLSAISRYDDYKCIARIICEMSTGVIPEIAQYKQSYTNNPLSSLISLLTSFNIGDSSSPLLFFGKSALMGYSNRGNPDVCYHQYPRCPRNPEDLVNYLNNYKGGFFRFFSGYNSKSAYHPAITNDKLLSPDKFPAESITDRKGTGELKYDSKTKSHPRILEFKSYSEKDTNHRKIRFPDDNRSDDSIVQIIDYQSRGNFPEKNLFFPQDRKDHDVQEIVYDFTNYGDDESYEKKSEQQMMIEIDNKKLFSNELKKSTVQKGLINDDVLKPIDLEGLNVINLVELYAEDETQLEHVFHPCDMICHDSRGTSVQFSQVLNYDSLSTFMAPERPILDLSEPLPCQIICRNEHDERRGIFTTLSRVLQASSDRKKSLENSSTNESLQVKVIKPRFVGDSMMDEKIRNPPLTLSDPNSMLLSRMSPMQLTGGQTGPLSNIQQIFGGQGSPILGNQQGMMMPFGDTQMIQEDAAVGDNPLAIIINSTEPTQSAYDIGASVGLGGLGQQPALPASFTMCGSLLYIVPLNAIATPVCTTSTNTQSANHKPMLHIEQNPWGNYTNFFRNLAEDDELAKSNEFNVNPTEFVMSNSPSNVNRVKPSFPDLHHQQVSSTKYNDNNAASNVEPDVAVLNPRDYPQGSCVEGKSQKLVDNQCVPITSHDDEYKYINQPDRLESHGIPFEKREQPQRIIIKTPSANMYIQSNDD